MDRQGHPGRRAGVRTLENLLPRSPGSWTSLTVPLSGGGGWARSQTGNPTATYGWEDIIRANRDYFKEVASFDGSSGVGVGLLSARPASGSTVGVGYWATDQGSWNTDNLNAGTSGYGAGEGQLYTWTGSAPDTTAPTPNPSTIASVAVNSATSITVTASTATDVDTPPVEYAFSSDNGSSWTAYQSSATYAFTSLTAATTYHFKVKAHDAAGTPNVTTPSAATDGTTFALTPDAGPNPRRVSIPVGGYN